VQPTIGGLEAREYGAFITITSLRASNSPRMVSVTLKCEASLDLPPSDLAYSSSSAVYTVGVAIPPNAPTSRGGVVASYSVAPALPAGLTLDPITGMITGTPTAATAGSTYTVTATNARGSTTAVLGITVNPRPTRDLPRGAGIPHDTCGTVR